MQDSSMDTKTRIFNAALRLFATDGVENATTRGIADAAGIKSASIYNHYKSKDEILEDCYKFLANHFSENRMTKEQYLPILKNGTKEEVIQVPNYYVPVDKHGNIVYALIVIFTRIRTDTRAHNIFLENKAKSLAYLNDFFETGIDIGRFASFDYQTLSQVYYSIRLNGVFTISTEPHSNTIFFENQAKMLNMLIGLIPFRY